MVNPVSVQNTLVPHPENVLLVTFQKSYSTGPDGSAAVVAVITIVVALSPSGGTAKVIGSGSGALVSTKRTAENCTSSKSTCRVSVSFKARRRISSGWPSCAGDGPEKKARLEVVQAVTGQLNASGLFNVNLIINESGVFSEKASVTGTPRKVGQITIYSHGNSTLDPDFTLSRSFGLRQPPHTQLASHQTDEYLDGLIKEAATEMNDDERI